MPVETIDVMRMLGGKSVSDMYLKRDDLELEIDLSDIKFGKNYRVTISHDMKPSSVIGWEGEPLHAVAEENGICLKNSNTDFMNKDEEEQFFFLVEHDKLEEAISCAVEFKDQKKGAILIKDLFDSLNKKDFKIKLNEMTHNLLQQTPLHQAAKKNNMYAYVVLSYQGANSYQNDRFGKSPFEYRAKHKWDDAALRTFNAEIRERETYSLEDATSDLSSTPL